MHRALHNFLQLKYNQLSRSVRPSLTGEGFKTCVHACEEGLYHTKKTPANRQATQIISHEKCYGTMIVLIT